MKNFRLRLSLALAGVVVALVVGYAIRAQTSASYNLEWNAVGGGATTASSASYEMSGTIGQSLTSVAVSANYRIAGGFWTTGLSDMAVYLPIVYKAVP